MKKKYVLLLPILFTILIAVIGLLTPFLMRFISIGELNINIIISSQIFAIFSICVVFYTCYYYFSYNKNLVTFIAILAGYYLLSILITTGIGGSFQLGLYNISTMITYSITGLLLYLAYDRFNKSRLQKELKRQNLKSELALLKNQINPHFLFNTLNNIDSLIKSDPDRASATLVELSGMMRYMIYDTNVDKVPLKQELTYIENYLDLQKMQFSNPNLVNYQVEGNSENLDIPPMLFIPFIENAFKHCNDKNTEYAINISFIINREIIQFRATNIANAKHQISKDKSSGVGLDIVKRRLQILYPNKHMLDIKKENNLFCVSLDIKN